MKQYENIKKEKQGKLRSKATTATAAVADGGLRAG